MDLLWLSFLAVGLFAAPSPAQVPSLSNKPPLSDILGSQSSNKTAEEAQILAGVACALSGQLCPPPLAPSPSRSSPSGYAPGPLELENGDYYYLLPKTRLTFPGTQTRTRIEEMFPAIFFDAPKSGIEAPAPSAQGDESRTGASNLTSYLAAPVPAGSNGGWVVYSTDSGVEVIHATPLSNGQVFMMERPGNREAAPQIAAVYNLNTNTWKYFPMTDSPFCAGHIQLINDNVLIVGGDNINLNEDFVDGRFNIRVFTGGPNPAYQIVARMQPFFPPNIDPASGGRWYPSLCTMVDGNVLIVSGSTTEGGGYGSIGVASVNPTYQFFQVRSNTLTANTYLAQIQNTNPINLYPYTTVMPVSGLVMIISGVQTLFYTYTAPGTLTNNTNTYPAIPNLPIPILFPQTSSIVMLPLELPNYTPRFLVVGGNTADQADPTTPATANTYFLDLSQAGPTWQLETMSAARVMPDTVLLPDGTLFVCNGGTVGIAGGTSGAGESTSNGMPQAGEIYNPNNPVGSRFGGLLASSGRDRLYHSVAWLTTNAEVMVTGSETTADYTMQIYTPPYLTGTFVRPMISALSTGTPAYGATFTVTLTFAGGAPVPISRVVFNRVGGITHSTHFDQRQVACVYTQTSATSLTVTAPPSTSVAPPGIYQLFVVSNTRRPSMAYQMGLGGATPQAPYVQPTATPILANGAYTIASNGRAGCNNLLSAVNCNVDNTIQMAATGYWRLTYLPNAPRPNTYDVVYLPRSGYCNSYLGAQRCNGNSVFLYPRDDISGRQQWTLTPAAGGGYTIQVLVGRELCNPGATFLGTVTCAANANAAPVNMVGANAGNGLQTWTLTAVTPPAFPPQAPFVPYFANATYTITNNGRAACLNGLNASGCATANVFMATGSSSWLFTQLPNAERTNTYTLIDTDRPCTYSFLSGQDCNGAAIDLFGQDDGSGRQQFTFTAVAGGYTMQLLNGRPTCGSFVTAAACNSGNTALTFSATNDGTGLQVWTIGGAAVGPILPNGNYQIRNTARGACNNILSAVTCAAGNGVDMELGGTYTLTYLQNARTPNTYQITNLARTGSCNQYLSAQGCPGGVVDMYFQDDGSGHQEWTISQVTGGYTITIQTGRAGCPTFLASATCANGNGVGFIATNDGSGLGVWAFVAVQPATPVGAQLFQNGIYTIGSQGRAGCGANLNSVTCANGNGVNVDTPAGQWRLTYLPGAVNANTYQVTSVARTGTCNQYLSGQGCPGTVVDMYFQDDGSGRQEWTFAPATGGGYTITMSVGREGCAIYLTTVTCATGNGVTFANANAGNGLQTWTVTAVGAPVPPTTPAGQRIANGQYQIVNSARGSCAAYLGAQTCTQGNGIALSNGGVWTLTYLPNAPNANTYEVEATARAGSCNTFLSSQACPGGVIDLYYVDDGSGRQQWSFVPVGTGYYIEVLQGRTGCGNYFSAQACGVGGAGTNNPLFVTAPGNANLEVWNVIAPAAPAQTTQTLANGNYYIQSAGRGTACDRYLSASVACGAAANVNGVTMAPADDGSGLQIWTLTYLPNAPQANTYELTIAARSTCNQYLSASDCPRNFVDLYYIDDGSGRQQWTVTAVGTGIYSITIPQGRAGCNTFLEVGACGAESGDIVDFGAGYNSALQAWTFTAVNPAAG